MKGIVLALLSAIVLPATAAPAADCPAVLDHQVKRLDGSQTVSLCEAYAGKVILIVNTASKCAFTPQYEGLEALYSRYRSQGLVILGFPSNDFGNQEPGSEKTIREFCRLTYGVKFPMFSKTRVREDYADPLYRTLGQMAGEYPSWNFHKYLISRTGELLASFGSQVQPDDKRLVKLIEAQL